jgi:hypothetical protein
MESNILFDTHVKPILPIIKKGDIEYLKINIKKQYGFDVNIVSTLLIHAVQQEQYEICKFLINLGADVNIIFELRNNLLTYMLINIPIFDKNIFKLIIIYNSDTLDYDYYYDGEKIN